MTNHVETVAAVVARKSRSFDQIRKATGLTLTDEQLAAMAVENPGRFKLVRFVKRDGAGNRILPGRPGMRANTART